MSKAELLKKVHEIIWRNGDFMNQESLEEIQELVARELIEESKMGNVVLERLGNGFIKQIVIAEKVAN